MNVRWNCLFAFLAAIPFLHSAEAQVVVPVVVNTNTTIRIVAANLSSGSNQRYETAGRNILKGLKPDVVAIQEFNYQSSTHGINTPAAFREMIDNTFGTNFVYFRETGKSIPNGVISRYPILTNGVWDDVEMTDREFVWAKLDIPGTNELFVVSVHLKASNESGDPEKRERQAEALKILVQSNFPASEFIVVAGDMNIQTSGEACLATFKTYLSDSPIPHDGTGSSNPNTNAGRDKRYDYVFPGPTLNTNRVPTVIGSRSFANGLVFDSRVYSPLSDVSPVSAGDSGVSGMQHMAVVKDFRIHYTVTNYVTMPRPLLGLVSTNILRWNGVSNANYTVQSSTNLTNWFFTALVSSTSTNFSFTNSNNTGARRFYRVTYP